MLAVYLLLPLVAREGDIPFQRMAAHTAYSLGGSFLLAYLTYRLMLPLENFQGPLDDATRVWIETALQAILDGE